MCCTTPTSWSSGLTSDRPAPGRLLQGQRRGAAAPVGLHELRPCALITVGLGPPRSIVIVCLRNASADARAFGILIKLVTAAAVPVTRNDRRFIFNVNGILIIEAPVKLFLATHIAGTSASDMLFVFHNIL